MVKFCTHAYLLPRSSGELIKAYITRFWLTCAIYRIIWFNLIQILKILPFNRWTGIAGAHLKINQIRRPPYYIILV